MNVIVYQKKVLHYTDGEHTHTHMYEKGSLCG